MTVLALVRLGRRGEALAALRDVASRHRVAVEMLLAETPKRPKPDPGFGVVMGGKEEAGDYRAAWNEVRKGLRPYTGEP
jgi:hypothetical protein